METKYNISNCSTRLKKLRLLRFKVCLKNSRSCTFGKQNMQFHSVREQSKITQTKHAKKTSEVMKMCIPRYREFNPTSSCVDIFHYTRRDSIQVEFVGFSGRRTQRLILPGFT